MTTDSGYQARKYLTLNERNDLVASSSATKSSVDTQVLQALKHILSFARESVPYYGDVIPQFDEALPEKLSGDSSRMPQDVIETLLSNVPVLTRNDIQRNLERIQYRAPNSDPSHYLSTSSSGSTGSPVVVYRYAPKYVVDYDAVTLLEWQWHQLGDNSTVAMIRAVDHDRVGAAPMGIPLEFIDHSGIGHTRRLDDVSASDALAFIHQVQPDVVFTNGVMTRAIARTQIENSTHHLSVDAFVVTSDRVDDDMRKEVRDAFGARIVERYSCEEIGYIAIQCPFDTHLHVVAPHVLVEVVDENNLPIPAGTPGRILVTSLRNQAQPMIRYELGDIGVLGEPCAHGISWPVLASVSGRVREGITLQDGTFHMVHLYPTVLARDPRIHDFVILKFDNAIVVAVLLDEGGDRELIDQIVKDVAAVFHGVLPVVLRQLPEGFRIARHGKREWYPAVGDYVEHMSDEQLLSAGF